MKRKRATKAAKRRRKNLSKRGRTNRNKRRGTRGNPRVRRARRSSTRRIRITDPRVARGLGSMRREGISASKAAQGQKMKLKTFLKGARGALYQSGPGKPWRVRSEDQLAVSMSLLTRQGRITVIVRNSRERRLLHQYELAVHMFRSAAGGAEEGLKRFEGQTIAGHELVTDIKTLIELEEADELDYDNFYTDLGSKS